MVMTSFPSHATGPKKVKARITADTICSPHGPVSEGQIVEVTTDEFFLLKHANKAELHVEAEPEPSQELSIDDFKAALDKKTKPEIVAFAKNELGLDLNPDDKKDALIEAVMVEAKKIYG